MFVQPLCSQKLAACELGIFLRVSLAFIIENDPHTNKKGKANSRVVLGSLDWNLKLSGMRLVLVSLVRMSCACAHSGVCVSNVVSRMEKSQEVLYRFMQH